MNRDVDLFVLMIGILSCSTFLLAGLLVIRRWIASPAYRVALAWSGLLGLLICLIGPLVPFGARLQSLCSPALHVAAAGPLGPVSSEPLGVPRMATTDHESQANSAASTNLPLSSATKSHFQKDISWSSVALVIWISGSCFISAWLVVGSGLVWRLRWQARKAPEQLTQLLSMQANEKIPVWLGVHDGIGPAVSLGLIRPCILLSSQTVAQAVEQPFAVRMLLRHELAHHRNRDLWLRVGYRMLRIIYWTNPLFWIFCRRTELDQELVADAEAAGSGESRGDYAEELVRWARDSQPVGNARWRTLFPHAGMQPGPSELRMRLAELLSGATCPTLAATRRWSLMTGGLVSASAMVMSLLGLGIESPTLAGPQEPAAETAPLSEAPAPIARLAELSDEEFMKGSALKKNTIRIRVRMPDGTLAKNTDLDLTLGVPRSKDLHVDCPQKTDDFGIIEIRDVINVTHEKWKPLVQGNIDRAELAMSLPSPGIVIRKIGFTTHTYAFRAFGIYDRGSNVVVQLKTAATINGRVLDPEGRPVSGAAVVAGFEPVKTDAEGRFSIVDMEPCDYGDDFSALDKKLKEVKGDLSKLKNALGLVRFGYVSYVQETGELGVSLMHPPSVIATHPDFAENSVPYNRIPCEVEIRFTEPAARMEVSVIDPLNKEPIRGLGMMVHSIGDSNSTGKEHFHYAAWKNRKPAVSGVCSQKEDGRFKVDSLASGTYTFTFGLSEYFIGSVSAVTVKSGETTRVGPILASIGTDYDFQIVDATNSKPLSFDQVQRAELSIHASGSHPMNMHTIAKEITKSGRFRAKLPPWEVGLLLYEANGQWSTSTVGPSASAFGFKIIGAKEARPDGPILIPIEYAPGSE